MFIREEEMGGERKGREGKGREKRDGKKKVVCEWLVVHNVSMRRFLVAHGAGRGKKFTKFSHFATCKPAVSP